jgi:hypothetical protein
MCYRAYTQEDREERTAVEDMSVYKIMSLWRDGSLRSWYIGEEYKVGKTNRQQIPLNMKRANSSEKAGGFIIRDGYHSYNSRTTKPVIRNGSMFAHADKNMGLTEPLVCRILNDLGDEAGGGYLVCWDYPQPQLEGALTLDEFRERFKFDTAGLDLYGGTCVIARCTVPKGAHYYENGNGEIVSDAIRVDSYECFTKPKEDKND